MTGLLNLFRQGGQFGTHLLIGLIAGSKLEIVHLGNRHTSKHHRSILHFQFLHHTACLHQLQLHHEMQLHGVAVVITAPVVPHLFEEFPFEVGQLRRLLLAGLQIFAIGIYLWRSVLLELLRGYIEFLDGELSGLGMKQGQEQIRSLDEIIILILLAAVIIGCIIIFPFEELNAYSALLVDLIQSTH